MLPYRFWSWCWIKPNSPCLLFHLRASYRLHPLVLGGLFCPTPTIQFPLNDLWKNKGERRKRNFTKRSNQQKNKGNKPLLRIETELKKEETVLILITMLNLLVSFLPISWILNSFIFVIDLINVCWSQKWKLWQEDFMQLQLQQMQMFLLLCKSCIQI